MDKHVRVLIAKAGLDGHDRGAKIIAQALRDAGMEVIYTGLRQTPDQIVQTALQEDVQVIGISCLSGAHMHLMPPIIEKLKENEASDIIVLGGGVIPAGDIPGLKAAGIREVFTPGTPTSRVIEFIRDNVL